MDEPTHHFLYPMVQLVTEKHPQKPHFVHGEKEKVHTPIQHPTVGTFGYGLSCSHTDCAIAHISIVHIARTNFRVYMYFIHLFIYLKKLRQLIQSPAIRCIYLL
jgi:hypothetical protein